MIPETDSSFLYLALFLGVFSGAILTWAALASIPTVWKIRQKRVEEAKVRMIMERLALDQEEERLKSTRLKVNDLRRLKELSDITPASERAIDTERKRIANELHDDTVQRMAAVRLRLEEFSYRLDKPELVDMLSALGEEMNQIMKSLRFVIYGLPQPQFEINSFSVLIKDFLVTRLNRVAGKTIEFCLENEQAEFVLPISIKKELYNLVQEAIQNSLKHSAGFHLKLSVVWSSNLVIEVTDNGQGYIPQAGASHGLGFMSMEERASVIGAKLYLMPSSYGFGVRILLPNHFLK